MICVIYPQARHGFNLPAEHNLLPTVTASAAIPGIPSREGVSIGGKFRRSNPSPLAVRIEGPCVTPIRTPFIAEGVLREVLKFARHVCAVSRPAAVRLYRGAVESYPIGLALIGLGGTLVPPLMIISPSSTPQPLPLSTLRSLGRNQRELQSILDADRSATYSGPCIPTSG